MLWFLFLALVFNLKIKLGKTSAYSTNNVAEYKQLQSYTSVVYP